MYSRRLLLALPLIFAGPARADHPDDLAHVLVICWAARGVRFTPEAVRERIGNARGRAALLAIAGATTNADGDGEETAVEIVWEAGRNPLPTAPLLQHDLRRGLPLLLIDQGGQPWVLHALDEGTAHVTRAARGERAALPLTSVALIARPVIAGA